MAQERKKAESRQELKPAQAAPTGRALSPFEEMERFMGDVFGRDRLFPWRSEAPLWARAAGSPFEGRMPKVDIIDRDDEVVVRAELPGVDKKDIEVSMTDYAVTIKGESRKEEKEERGDYYRCETSRGAFTRTLAIPAEVDGSKARAKFKDGVLELTLPKREGSKRQTIKVD